MAPITRQRGLSQQQQPAAAAPAPFRPPPGLPAPSWQVSLDLALGEQQEAPCPFPPPPGLPTELAPRRAKQAPPGLLSDTPPVSVMRAPQKAQPPAAASGDAALKPIGANVTTLVVQNLPGRYTQDDMLALWPVDGTYDYMHVPYNLLQKRPLGYVFINFTSNELAAAFQRKWHGRVPPSGANSGGGARRPLDVSAAEVQGRQANLELIKGRKISQLGKAGFLPLVLENGRRLDAKAIIAGGRAGPVAPKEDRRVGKKAAPEEEQPGWESDAPTTAFGGDEACACSDSGAEDASSVDGEPQPMYIRLRL